MIVAVDPSINSPGAAVMIDGELVAATRLVTDGGFAEEERGDRSRHAARKVASWVRLVAPVIRTGVRVVVVHEWPQIYRASKSKGDPNDLPALAAIGALVAEMLGADRALSPLPAEWIGQLPKVTKGDPWKSPRGRRIASVLSATERALVPASHDAIDAVGLALWAAGRLERRRVYPGAT